MRTYRRMKPGSGRAAFTLIEILVVVAVITILVAILMPALARARASARMTVCGSHMRQIGMLFLNFAAENQDRGPGVIQRTIPTTASVSWADVLNITYMNNGRTAKEYLDQLFNKSVGQMFIQNSGVRRPRSLVCPEFAPYPNSNSTNACYGYNVNAAGWLPNNVGPNILPILQDNSLAYNYYYLGAHKFSEFNASYQFLLIETSGTGSFNWTGSPGFPARNDALTPVTYGNFTFRHGDTRLANFLFFDAHVETMPPSSNINTSLRVVPQ